jgi:hypothetical protein
MDHKYVKSHLTIHKCCYPNCCKEFKSAFSLKRHEYLHKNEKKYACEVCNKTFALFQYLKEHSYIHTGELPYLCGINGCTQRFRQACKLCVHRKTHQAYSAQAKANSNSMEQEPDQECNRKNNYQAPIQEEINFFDFSSYFIKIRKHITKKREKHYLSQLILLTNKKRKCYPIIVSNDKKNRLLENRFTSYYEQATQFECL